MRAAGSRFTNGHGRAIAAALVSVLLASCTSSTDPNFEMGMPGYNADGGVMVSETGATNDLPGAATAAPMMSAEGDTDLPAQVTHVPALNPAASPPAEATAEASVAVAPAATENAQPAQPGIVAQTDVTQPEAGAPAGQPAQAASAAPAADAQNNPDAQTDTAQNAVQVTAVEQSAPRPIAPKKKSFLSSFFGASPTAAAPERAQPAQPEAAAQPEVVAQPDAAQPKAAPAAEQPVQLASAAPAAENPDAQDDAAQDAADVTAAEQPAPQPIEPRKKSFLSSFFGASPASAAPSPIKPREAKPIITLASASSAEKPVRLASLGGSENALPGVRQTALFEIKHKSGIDDDSDVDLHEDEDSGPIQLASAAGLARLAPNGLLKQTDRVDVACLKPSLVRVLKTVEQYYGKKMVVTSGYRSPAHNRRARGAKRSLHMYCAAVDVQIGGVSKWELAKFVRSMPGRGGVGTYCHTESVHIDVGPERDWNWRCRRRK